jgi:RNA polymerase sigma-70 factor (ECF subfamily)
MSETRASLTTTQDLLERIRSGDEVAREALYQRFIPGLRRWARGRLPHHVRDLSETDDLVQVAVIRSLSHVEEFKPEREGAFLAYLHRILINCIRDEFRRSKRLPDKTPLPDGLVDDRLTTLESTLGLRALEAYERALEQMSDVQREAVVLRIEFGFTFPEIAQAIGKPSANAARMVVSRAMARVAELMDDETN